MKQNTAYGACITEQGYGTACTRSIPLYGSPASTAAPAEHEGADAAVEERQVILLVEDEPDIVQLLQMMLEKNGYRVRSAPDAESALKLDTQAISLLLADVGLPGMNGVWLYERMHAANPDLQGLFMSGYALKSLYPHQSLQEGVNFLSKPFSINNLVGMVQRSLDP